MLEEALQQDLEAKKQQAIVFQRTAYLGEPAKAADF